MPEQQTDANVEKYGNDGRASVSVSPDKAGGEQAKFQTDAEQSEQIRKLNRKVVGAWIAAFLGPVISIAGLAISGLQLKFGEGQLQAAKGQLEVMRAQLKDAHDGAAQARKDTEAAIAAATSQAASLRTLAGANETMAYAAKLSAENSERIARANELSLKAAARSIEVTEEIARSEQRAWLSVARLDGEPIPNGTWTPTVTIVNAGRTPAHDLHISSSIYFTFRPETRYGRLIVTDERHESIPPMEKDTSTIVALQPGESFQIRRIVPNPDPMSTSETPGLYIPMKMNMHFTKYYVEIRMLHFSGVVTYKDIFDMPHEVQFNYCYMPDGYAQCPPPVRASPPPGRSHD